MNKNIQLILAAFLLIGLISSCDRTIQKPQTEEVVSIDSIPMKNILEEATPVIDRAIFFGNPVIARGKLSPNGQYVTFMKEYNGVMNVWVKGFDESFDKARLLTDSESPIRGYFWTDDSKYVLFVNDKGGDENFNVYAVNPLEGTLSTAPEAKNLTPMEGITARIYMVSKKNPDMMMVGINDRDKAWHDLYSLKISTGELTKILENDNRYVGFEFDWDEKMRIAYRSDESGMDQIIRIDDNGAYKEIYNTNLQESASIANWTPDNKECYLITNKGDINLSLIHI